MRKVCGKIYKKLLTNGKTYDIMRLRTIALSEDKYIKERIK